MAENDLSRIVSLIMENPTLVEQIKELSRGAKESDTSESHEEAPPDIADAASRQIPISVPQERGSQSKRKELFSALKPYLSEGRGRAIETMMSIVDILDMMKTR